MKKVLSVFLTICLIVSCMVGISVHASADYINVDVTGGTTEAGAKKIDPSEYDHPEKNEVNIFLKGGFFIFEDSFLSNQLVIVEEDSTIIIPEGKSPVIKYTKTNNTLNSCGITVSQNKKLVLKGGGTLTLGSVGPLPHSVDLVLIIVQRSL